MVKAVTVAEASPKLPPSDEIHPANRYPGFGTAVKVTTVPLK